MSRLERIKTSVEIVVGVVGVAAVLIGGMWGYCEYVDRKADGRVSETLKYVERLNQEPAWSAHHRISRAWHAAKDDVVRVLTVDYTEPKWRNFVNDLVDDNELAIDIETILDFYEGLKICVDNNICDGSTAVAYFGEKASLFRNQHFVYFQALEIDLNDPALTQELEAFVRSYRDSLERQSTSSDDETSICEWLF